MSAASTIIAVDLGASNARVIAGTLDGDRLAMRVLHRVSHAPRMLDGALRWDWPVIQSAIREGLAAASEDEGPIAAVSCASWAQDFGLLDASGRLIEPPVCYRDARTAGMPESFRQIIAPDDLVRRVGSTASPVITLCQLRALAEHDPGLLARADCLLHIADLVHHELCGARITDRTMATASGLRALATGRWDADLLAALGVPARILPEVAEEPRVIGVIRGGPQPSLDGAPVVAGVGHDTAAASVLCTDGEHAFLSCGTWSMLGIIADEPVIPDAPARDGLAILGMAGQRWSLMRPLAGLWALQQCQQRWRSEHREPAREAVEAAAGALDDDAWIALDALSDLPPQRVADAIGTRLGATEPAAVAAILIRSLAAEHALGLEALERATGRHCTALRIVGGGSMNALLCRLTAQICARPVIAGPAEATAAGVIVTAAFAVGLLPPAEVAPLLERSVAPVRYEPADDAGVPMLETYRELKARVADD